MSNTKRNIDAVGRRRGELKTINGKVHHWVPGKGWVARTAQEQANVDANRKKNETNPDFTTPPKTENKKTDNKVVKKDNKKTVKPASNKVVKPASNKSSKSKFSSNVHTRHYKTGERLGVMGANARRKYEREAAGRTFEGEVAKYEKSSAHGKSHLRETLYKRNQKWGKKTKLKTQSDKPKTESKKNKLTIKEQHKSKLDQQQNETAKIMQNDPRYLGPKYKKKKNGGK